jgi:hypothetical protein
MKQIVIRAYRVAGSNDIAISSKELLNYLNTDMGNNIGNDEKLIALEMAINNMEHNVPIYERFRCISVDPSINMAETVCAPDYMLSIKV